MSPPDYSGPERRTSVRQHIWTDEEIDMLAGQDAKAVNRMVLKSLNRIVATLDEQQNAMVSHLRESEDLNKEFESVGGMSSIKARAEFVDALIVKTKSQASLLQSIHDKLLTSGALGVIKWTAIALIVLVAFYWNSHAPDGLQIPILSAAKLKP